MTATPDFRAMTTDACKAGNPHEDYGPQVARHAYRAGMEAAAKIVHAKATLAEHLDFVEAIRTTAERIKP